jgi:hypothetical protein
MIPQVDSWRVGVELSTEVLCAHFLKLTGSQ